MNTITKITSKWSTIATVGYSGSVNPWNENRAAHGAVCHLQVRRAGNGIQGRKINTNGRAQEKGAPFALDAETLARWEKIEKSSH